MENQKILRQQGGRTLRRVVAAIKGLRIRLKSRQDSEHEQAILRIVIVAVVFAYMAATYSPGNASAGSGHGELLLLEGLAGALTLSIVLFASICIWPSINVPRRVVGMLADAGAATFCMFLAGESGVSMMGVYLFITFGNGFRYGREYLFGCQLLCIAGYSSVLLLAPYWQGHGTAGWCLMIALIVLPLYVSTLLKRIQEARARAEEANRAKSSFLANMSHEMRTPLNGILGVADLLQTTNLSSQQLELMRLMRHSVTLLRYLVDDVLDISKIEAGRLAIETVDFDLHATLNGLVGLLRPHAKAKGLTFHAMVDPAIDYRLRGDPHHLRQVLLNLLSNAIKFTEHGEVAIAVTLLTETEQGLRLRFEVRDSGIGMGADVQQRIFERFVQADNSTTRRYGGTGLGTTIAKQLVELMGGQIGVKSLTGVGSTFWLELPLLKTAAVNPQTSITSDSEVSAMPLGAMLVADTSRATEFRVLVEAACGRVEVVSPAELIAAPQRYIKERESSLAAVVVYASVPRAMEVFNVIGAKSSDNPFALIYVGDSPIGLEEEHQLGQSFGAICVQSDVNLRVLRNAIHAATARAPSEGAEIIDLGQVLQEQRQPLRILVAEDNATNQAIIRKLLESAGHSVLLASDGDEALDIFESEGPELALLDFNMPERNGMEVCAAIRTMEPPGTRLPIIILSASVTIEARERARQFGADEFVGKPFEAANVLQVIDRLARRSSRSARPRSRVSPQLPAGQPLVDRARFVEVGRIARNDAFLGQLVTGFRTDIDALLVRLEAAITSEQRTAIADIMHAVRGAALSMGAQQLAMRCTAMEDAAARGQFSQIRAQAQELHRCFDATSAQLTAYAARKDASV